MIIKNGTVLNENFEFVHKDIKIADGLIEILEEHLNENDMILDAEGCYVVPGFVDTHMHGAMGKTFIDFEQDTYEKIASYEAKNGTTSLVPAISAAPEEKLLDCIGYMKNCRERVAENCAQIYGVHLEGPFFSEKYRGAHQKKNIRNTDVNELNDYINMHEGCIKIITLAPELPGAEAVVRRAAEEGICVSIGHTDADYEQVKNAVSWGASQATHLFNAMRPLSHREPGTVGGCLMSDVKCELICDFFHVHQDVVKMVYDLKGPDHINMITDSELGTGLPDGEYFVNGGKIVVKEKKAYTGDGTIAGGSTCLIDGVRNLVSLGIPLEEACKMASRNPAQSVGIYDKAGSISIGKIADLVILNHNLEIVDVILRGRSIHGAFVQKTK